MENHSQLPPTLSEYPGQGDAPLATSGEQPETRTTSRLYIERGPERRANWCVDETARDFARIYDERGPGIDVPGVGHVVAINSVSPSPEISPVCAGREDAVDEVPRPGDRAGGAPSLKETRECLFVELLFAAKDLAEGQIEPATSDEAAFCTVCVAEAKEGSAIHHEELCGVGRVLRVIGQLCAIARPFEGLDVHPSEKETAADGETPEAGDGIRPRGPSDALGRVVSEPMPVDLLCLACGERGGEWICGSKVADGEAWSLRSNQRITSNVAQTGLFLYTHRCDPALAVQA